MLLFDYHIHSCHSSDARFSVGALADAAVKKGLGEICITDHVDFDDPTMTLCDLNAQRAEVEFAQQSCPIPIRRGAEVGLESVSTGDLSYDYIKEHDLDFVIASLHIVNGENTYYPEYFDRRSLKEGYTLYINTLNRAIRTFTHFSVMGHYDFVTKYAPFRVREMSLAISPTDFDEIFTYLAQNGKSMEVNTSAWRDGAAWGLDVLKRFRELGGEYITIGSDAHTPDRVGSRLSDAVALARKAGIRYISTFERMKPILHKIDE